MTAMTTATPTPAGVAHRSRATHRAAANSALFALVAVSVGWAGVALDKATGAARGNSLGMGLWLVLPALTAVLLVRLRPDGGGPLGLTLRFPHRTRWFGFAALLYLPLTALIVLTGVAAGLGSFHATSAAGKPALLAASAAALAPLALKNTLEELMWRGFGTRTAIAAGLPRLRAHLLVGFTWALWHLPFYAYFMTRADFRATTSLSWPLFLPVFFAGVLAVAVVFGELRLRTGSIWPGVLMHTIGGALVNSLILNGHLTYSGHGDALFSPAPNSLASIVALSLIGLLLLRRADKPLAHPQTKPLEAPHLHA
jgi:membrane protease YdiL (CAAX protease family)